VAASGWYKDARFIAVALHTLGVAVVTLYVAPQVYGNQHVASLWCLLFLLDFPVSFLAVLIAPVLTTVLSPGLGYREHVYWELVVVPAVLFAFLGGLQWFGIASVIRWVVRRKDRSRCRKCGYALRGLPEPRCPECGTPFDAALMKELHGNGS